MWINGTPSSFALDATHQFGYWEMTATISACNAPEISFSLSVRKPEPHSSGHTPPDANIATFGLLFISSISRLMCDLYFYSP